MKKPPVAQLDRASAFGAEGCTFESCRAGFFEQGYMINKQYILQAIFLFSLIMIAGCATVQTREDVLRQAKVIKEKHVEEEVSLPGPMPLVSLPVYEKLFFKAKYLGITVGTMTTEIKGMTKINGRDAYEFEVTAKTNNFFSKFFKVEDRFVSYMDAEHLHVLRHEEYRREGNYRKEAIVDFDHVNHKAHYQHLFNNSAYMVDIPDNVLDVVTANYYVRMRPWSVGDTFDLAVYVDEEVYNLLGLIKTKTRLRVPKLGRREVFVFQPYAMLDGEEVKKGKAVGYFATDHYRTPLKGLVKTPIFGSASIVFDKAEYQRK